MVSTKHLQALAEEQATVVWLDPEEGRAQFDDLARRWLGISGDEFIRRFDAGEYRAYADSEKNSRLFHLTMLIAFGRMDDATRESDGGEKRV